jgi:hypothetical protein
MWSGAWRPVEQAHSTLANAIDERSDYDEGRQRALYVHYAKSRIVGEWLVP